MPTPDASQYVEMKRVQSIASAISSVSPLKFRAPGGLSARIIRAGSRGLLSANAIKSNKFTKPPTIITSVELTTIIDNVKQTCGPYVVVSATIVATFEVDITSIIANTPFGTLPFIITSPRTAEYSIIDSSEFPINDEEPIVRTINFNMNNDEYVATGNYSFDPVPSSGSLARTPPLYENSSTPPYTNGDSIYFTGELDGYVCSGSNSVFTIPRQTDFTVMWWQYLDTTGSNNNEYPRVFNIGNSDGSEELGVSMEGTGSERTIYVWVRGNPCIYVYEGDIGNRWHHFAVIRYGSTITLYKNGISIGSRTTPLVVDEDEFDSNVQIGNGTSPLILGQRCTRNDQGEAFNGYISKFVVDIGTARYISDFDTSLPIANPTPIGEGATKLILNCSNQANIATDSSGFGNNVSFHGNNIHHTPGYAPRFPGEISFDSQYSFVCNRLGHDGSYTTLSPLVFTAPATATYTIIFSGISYYLRNVLSTSTPETYSTDAQSKTPDSFGSEDTISLTIGQKLYLMPVGEEEETLTIQISVAPIIVSFDTEETIPVDATSVTNGYSTQSPLKFIAPSDGRYKITYSGISNLYNVLSTTIPTSIITDSNTKTPSTFSSNTIRTLTAGEILYLMPFTNNNQGSLTIEITAVPFPITFYTQSSFDCDTQVPNSSTYVTLRSLVFTAPSTASYMITFSGISFGGTSLLYRTLATTTSETYGTDSSSQTPSSFESEDTISLTSGQELYLMPEGQQGQTLTIEITVPPIIVSFDTEETIPVDATSVTNGYSTQSPLKFIAPSDGRYKITYSGISNLYNVLSTTIPTSIITDSNTKTPSTFSSNTIRTLTAGENLYLMPFTNNNQGSLTIEITALPFPITLYTQSSFDCDTSDGIGNYTILRPLAFTAPDSGTYIITFSGINGTLFNVLSTSTPETYNTDYLSQTPQNFGSEDIISLTQGQQLYLMPQASEGETLSVQINVFPYILAIDTDYTRSVNTTGQNNKLTAISPFKFTATATASYKITYSATTASLLNVLSTSTPLNYLTDSATKTPSSFTSNDAITLTSGQELYLMPHTSDSNSDTITIEITAVPIPISYNIQYNNFVTEISIYAVGYTIFRPLEFVAPDTATYVITHSGTNINIYNVYSTTTPDTLTEDRNILTPNDFYTGDTISLTQGQHLYLMPLAGNDSQTLTIKITAIPTIISVDTEYINTLNTSGELNSYTTILPLKFTAPGSGNYVITYSGITNYIYNVLSTSTPANYITNSSTKTPSYFNSNDTITLTSGQVLYLMPRGSSGETLDIEITALPTPILFATQYSFLSDNILDETGYRTSFRPFKFTAPVIGTYRITYSGISSYVYNVLATTTPDRTATDSATKTPQNFETGDTISLTAGQVLYLMPRNIDNETFTIKISASPIPILFDTEYSFSFNTISEGGEYSTLGPLDFTAPSDGRYKIMFSGIQSNIRHVLSTTTPLTITEDSLTKNPTNFASTDEYILSSGQHLYLMAKGTQGQTLTIEITAVPFPIPHNAEYSFPMNILGATNKHTIIRPLKFTTGTTDTYRITFSGFSGDKVRNVLATSTPATYLTDSATKTPSYFNTNDTIELNSGSSIYLMPEGGDFNNETIYIEISDN